MKKTIFLQSGHSTTDPGAIHGAFREADEALKICDLLAPLLTPYLDVVRVPHDLNLVDAIKFVNEKCATLEGAFAFSIHLNAGGGIGAETFFFAGDETSERISKLIIDKYCQLTGYKNRGAKPDTASHAGRLGWIRDTKPWASLIELCFIDNDSDMKYLTDNRQKVAEALKLAILDVFEITPEETPEPAPIDLKSSLIDKIIDLADQLKNAANQLKAYV